MAFGLVAPLGEDLRRREAPALYNLGIATLADLGLIALRGDERGRRTRRGGQRLRLRNRTDRGRIRPAPGPSGRVYWARQGRVSVDVLGILSTLGTYMCAKPFWHEVASVTRRRFATAAS